MHPAAQLCALLAAATHMEHSLRHMHATLLVPLHAHSSVRYNTAGPHCNFLNLFTHGRHIRFNSRLTQLVQMPGANHGDAPMWVAQYTDRTSGQEYELAANFVVLSTGLFSTPFIPSFTVSTSCVSVCLQQCLACG